MTLSGIRGDTAASYRERLGPSLWFLVGSAVLAPMAALVLAPFNATLALVGGIAFGLIVITLLIAGAPVIGVRDGFVSAGRATIDARYLGTPIALTGEEARAARGPQLDPRAWHIIRGVDGLVLAPVVDPDDPTPVWVMSLRTPDRLAAAIRRAQTTPRTPSK